MSEGLLDPGDDVVTGLRAENTAVVQAGSKRADCVNCESEVILPPGTVRYVEEADSPKEIRCLTCVVGDGA